MSEALGLIPRNEKKKLGEGPAKRIVSAIKVHECSHVIAFLVAHMASPPVEELRWLNDDIQSSLSHSSMGYQGENGLLLFSKNIPKCKHGRSLTAWRRV
jgi:hypothetical protein